MNTPTVLAVLVVHDGGAWIQRALACLARQSHARLGILAIDNASTDGSAGILERVLGPRRVIRLPHNDGFPAAMRRAMELPAAREADYLLFLHDDTALDPEAVGRLVEAAERLDGVGVVGPKVVDWDDSTVLREVGFAADRFGFPHSPLEAGEIDQGQYDAPREVLFVSSAAMLVAREAWTHAGPPDDRLGPCHADLGFCWRLRVAGFRVLVAPRAVVMHRSAGGRAERPGGATGRERYHVERAALATVLTNPRLLTLLWLLPAFAVQGVVRLGYALISRRLDEAAQMLAAWGWNVAHLPGTIARRTRVQAARRTSDHEVSRFLTGGSPIRRWVLQGSALLTGARSAAVEPGEEAEDAPLRQRVGSVLVAHPVLVGLIVGLALTFIAFRGVIFAGGLEGGALPVMPRSAGAFFRELGSAWRTFGFGGDMAPSPALALLGAGSAVTFGAPAILVKLLVGFAPLLAATSCYRAVRRLPVPAVSAVAAAAAYAMSGLVLWTSSEGRIAEAALLVAVPWLWGRAVDAFGPGPDHPWRWAVATGMGLAVATAFYPSTWVAVVAAMVPLVVLPDRGGNPVRGVGLMALSAAIAAALLFPFVLTLAAAGMDGVVHPGRAAFFDLLRLVPGDAPGTGPGAWFLPIAALLSFAVAEGASARPAWRAMATAVAAVPLAWLAAAGHLSGPLAAPAAFLAVGAFSMARLVGLATGALFGSVRRTAFGTGQVAVALLGAVLVVGLAAQSLAVLPGGWSVGDDRLAPAWPVVASSEPAQPFRVLWLRRPDGAPFAAPGGDPQGVVAAGEASVAYGVTGRGGRSALALAVPGSGPGFDALERTLEGILSGRVRHGGAVLAPFAIRYVLAEPGTLPPAAAERLAAQADIDLVQRAGGLLLYRNAAALPRAAALPSDSVGDVRGTDLLSPTALDPGSARPLRGGGEAWTGELAADGVVLIGDRFDPAWRSRTGRPFAAFGWALGVEAPAGPFAIAFGGRVPYMLQLAGMAVLWAIALWVIRRRPSEDAARGTPAIRRQAARPVAGRVSAS